VFRFAAISALAVAVAGLMVAAPSASAATALTVTGSAPATAHGPGTVPFSYGLQVATELESVTVTTNQDAFLPADATSVTLDGAAVPATGITRTGGNLAIPLGPLATGAHTLTFAALVQATRP
jgi:hypothetical protein